MNSCFRITNKLVDIISVKSMKCKNIYFLRLNNFRLLNNVCKEGTWDNNKEQERHEWCEDYTDHYSIKVARSATQLPACDLPGSVWVSRSFTWSHSCVQCPTHGQSLAPTQCRVLAQQTNRDDTRAISTYCNGFMAERRMMIIFSGDP